MHIWSKGSWHIKLLPKDNLEIQVAVWVDIKIQVSVEMLVSTHLYLRPIGLKLLLNYLLLNYLLLNTYYWIADSCRDKNSTHKNY